MPRGLNIVQDLKRSIAGKKNSIKLQKLIINLHMTLYLNFFQNVPSPFHPPPFTEGQTKGNAVLNFTIIIILLLLYYVLILSLDHAWSEINCPEAVKTANYDTKSTVLYKKSDSEVTKSNQKASPCRIGGLTMPSMTERFRSFYSGVWSVAAACFGHLISSQVLLQ